MEANTELEKDKTTPKKEPLNLVKAGKPIDILSLFKASKNAQEFIFLGTFFSTHNFAFNNYILFRKNGSSSIYYLSIEETNVNLHDFKDDKAGLRCLMSIDPTEKQTKFIYSFTLDL